MSRVKRNSPNPSALLEFSWVLDCELSFLGRKHFYRLCPIRFSRTSFILDNHQLTEANYLKKYLCFHAMKSKRKWPESFIESFVAAWVMVAQLFAFNYISVSEISYKRLSANCTSVSWSELCHWVSAYLLDIWRSRNLSQAPVWFMKSHTLLPLHSCSSSGKNLGMSHFKRLSWSFAWQTEEHFDDKRFSTACEVPCQHITMCCNPPSIQQRRQFIQWLPYYLVELGFIAIIYR